MSVNDVMDDERLSQQVMMVDGKAKTVKEIMNDIRNRSKDKKGRQISLDEHPQ